MKNNNIPITVVTGQLGSGKTTIILNLIKQLPKDYKVVWLKNEYGDVNIDSELAKENNIQTQEILNGCLCCVLVGKLHDALLEIVTKFNPDRIIVETAGTAYPYPIILEIEKIEKIKLDGVINVIDSLNFKGFEDISYVAKTQAKFVDLVVINKTGLIDNDKLYEVEEDIYDLYYQNPKVKTSDGKVDKDLILGLDHKLFELTKNDKEILEKSHHHEEIEIFSWEKSKTFDSKEKFEEFLKNIPPTRFSRIKGIIKFENGNFLLNYVLGRFDWIKLEKFSGDSKITFMGNHINEFRDEVEGWLSK